VARLSKARQPKLLAGVETFFVIVVG